MFHFWRVTVKACSVKWALPPSVIAHTLTSKRLRESDIQVITSAVVSLRHVAPWMTNECFLIVDRAWRKLPFRRMSDDVARTIWISVAFLAGVFFTSVIGCQTRCLTRRVTIYFLWYPSTCHIYKALPTLSYKKTDSLLSLSQPRRKQPVTFYIRHTACIIFI